MLEALDHQFSGSIGTPQNGTSPIPPPTAGKAHASLLTDGRDVGATDLLGSTDVVL